MVWTVMVLLMPLCAVAQGRGVIVGVVTDTAGTPIAYARIAIVGTDRTTAAAQNGRYLLADVPAGTYKIRAAFIGYRPTDRDSIRVTANDTTRLDLQLRRGRNCDLDCSPVVVPARPPTSQ